MFILFFTAYNIIFCQFKLNSWGDKP